MRSVPRSDAQDDADALADRPRRFHTAFLGTLVALLLSIASLNVTVDPYGQYGSGMLPPVVRSSRAQKLALLRESGGAEGLILGSSRVLKLEPRYLEQALGSRWRNGGVYYGRPEDFLALVRAAHEGRGAWPSTLLIGVDVDGFVASPGPDPELLRTAALRDAAPELWTLGDRLRPVRELWSWQQCAASVRSVLRREAEHDAEPDETFARDGVVVYHRREREIARGEYDLDAAIAWDRKEYLRLYAGYASLDPRRVRAWRDLVGECEKHGVALWVFLTPWRPELLDELQRTTEFSRRRDEVSALLRGSLPEGGVFVDLTELKCFGGRAEDFLDGVHPVAPTTRRILDAVLREASAVASPLGGPRVAIQ